MAQGAAGVAALKSEVGVRLRSGSLPCSPDQDVIKWRGEQKEIKSVILRNHSSVSFQNLTGGHCDPTARQNVTCGFRR